MLFFALPVIGTDGQHSSLSASVEMKYSMHSASHIISHWTKCYKRLSNQMKPFFLYSVINENDCFKHKIRKPRSSCLQRMWNRGTSSKWCCWAKSTLFFLSTPRCRFSVCCVFTAWIEKHFYLRCTQVSSDLSRECFVQRHSTALNSNTGKVLTKTIPKIIPWIDDL